MKYLILILFICYTCECLRAQELKEQKYPQQKVYIELGMGGSTEHNSVSSTNLADIYAGRAKSSFLFNVRYFYFPLKHWGAYVGLEITKRKIDDEAVVNYFEHKFADSYYFTPPEYLSADSRADFNIGAAYRWNYKILTLRPYLGLILSEFSETFSTFQLKEIGTNNLITGRTELPGSFVWGFQSGATLLCRADKDVQFYLDVCYDQYALKRKKIYERLYDRYTTELIKEESHKATSSINSLGITLGISFTF